MCELLSSGLRKKGYDVAFRTSGQEAFDLLCAEDFDEDFSFDCTEIPAEGSEWYTVCGKPHTDFRAWMLGVSGLGAAGIALWSFLLGPLRRRRR